MLEDVTAVDGVAGAGEETVAQPGAPVTAMPEEHHETEAGAPVTGPAADGQ